MGVVQQNQLMLITLGWALGAGAPQSQLVLMMLGGAGPRNQLMLMMLGSILGHGPAEPPDAPDARHGFGCGDPTKSARPHKAS